jgi:hypothetical protein
VRAVCVCVCCVACMRVPAKNNQVPYGCGDMRETVRRNVLLSSTQALRDSFGSLSAPSDFLTPVIGSKADDIGK